MVSNVGDPQGMADTLGRRLIDPPAQPGGSCIGLWTDILSVQDLFVGLATSAFPPVPHDWLIKGLCMFSCVCATGHIKDPLPLIEKSRASCPGGMFPPSFLHQVIIITSLNKLYDSMSSP